MSTLISIISLLASLLLLTQQSKAEQSTRLIYQYWRDTWWENAAVRSNGDILLTSLNEPVGLYSINPFESFPPALVTNDFDGLNSTLGIVETDQDVFWVIASNFSLDIATLGTQSGTNAIFRVSLEDCGGQKTAASVSLLTYLSEAKFLNGLTKFNNSFLLAADSGLGVVWGLDAETGRTTIVAEDELMAPQAVDGFAEGINGLHLYENRLYFSNSQQRLLAMVELDENGYQKGPGVKVAVPVIEHGINPNWDDFAIESYGEYAYIATEIGNTIQRIDLNSGEVEIFAGGLNDSAIAQPTSTVFGRTPWDIDTLYAVTAGGFAYPVYTDDGLKKLGAQVVAIELDESDGT